MATADRSDPAVRATARLQRAQASDRGWRLACAAALSATALATLALAGPLTGQDGAWVGAIVTAVALFALVAAVWPYEWAAHERRHRELDGIWREVRSDADEEVGWNRYAAWAVSEGGQVQLWLITRRAADAGGKPSGSPYRSQVVRTIDGEDMVAAATAMEELRADAAEREAAARRQHDEGRLRAQRASYDRALADVDRSAEEYQRQRESQLQAELARQEAAERQAQADAVARALRKP